MFLLVVGGVVLPLCGEDKDHRELLYGRLWLSSRQTGGRSSSHSAVCFCLDYSCPSIINPSPPLSLFLYLTIHLSLCLSQVSMKEWNHLSELVLFALAMQETLKEVNRHSAKNFQLRVGKWLSSWPHTLTHAHTHKHTYTHKQGLVDINHSPTRISGY